MQANDRFFLLVVLFFEQLEVLVESHKQFAKYLWQAVFTIFQQFGNLLANVGSVLRKNEAIFGQQSTDLIDLGGLGFDESLPGSMLGPDVHLLTVFYRHEVHGEPSPATPDVCSEPAKESDQHTYEKEVKAYGQQAKWLMEYTGLIDC